MTALRHPPTRPLNRVDASVVSARTRRGTWLGIALVAGLAVGLPAVLAAATGNLSIPHNDAFAYSRIAQIFANTGSIRLVGWNHPFTVGQAILLGPIGSSVLAQQLLVVVLAALALVATYGLLRQSLPERPALLGTSLVAAFPGFGLLATSFMEELPAYLGVVLTLLTGTRAIERRSLPLLCLASVLGLWSFTIREQSAAALVSVLAAAFLAWTDRPQRGRVVIVAAVVAVGALGSELWRQSLPNGQQPIIHVQLGSAALTAVRAYFTAGLLLLPISAATARVRDWRRPVIVLAVLVGLVGIRFHLVDHNLLLGNYLDRNGAYTGVLAGSRVVLPAALWDLLQVAALAGGVLLIGQLGRAWRNLGLCFKLFVGLSVAGTALEVLVGEPTFDRFLIPLLPMAAIGLLADRGRRAIRVRWPVATVLLAGLAVVSLLITLNGLAFDAARWSQASRLVRAGVPATAIDAGLEWVGFHSTVPAVSARVNPGSAVPKYAQELYPQARECFVLTSSPEARLGSLIGVASYHTFLLSGHSNLYVYDTGRCARPVFHGAF